MASANTVAVVVSVTGYVIGLAGRFLNQLSPKIFERVVQFDVFGHSHTVLGNLGRTPALVQNSVAAARTECAADCASQLGTPANSGWRASSSNTICFATFEAPPGFPCLRFPCALGQVWPAAGCGP